MSRLDIKRRLLEIFTSRQEQVEAELKAAILNSEDLYYISMLYAVAEVSPVSKKIIEPWIRAIASTSRSVGGKGSEQLLNLLYPKYYQQYLFPYPMAPQLQSPQLGEKINQQPIEEKKRRFLLF